MASKRLKKQNAYLRGRGPVQRQRRQLFRFQPDILGLSLLPLLPLPLREAVQGDADGRGSANEPRSLAESGG